MPTQCLARPRELDRLGGRSVWGRTLLSVKFLLGSGIRLFNLERLALRATRAGEPNLPRGRVDADLLNLRAWWYDRVRPVSSFRHRVEARRSRRSPRRPPNPPAHRRRPSASRERGKHLDLPMFCTPWMRRCVCVCVHAERVCAVQHIQHHVCACACRAPCVRVRACVRCRTTSTWTRYERTNIRSDTNI